MSLLRKASQPLRHEEKQFIIEKKTGTLLQTGKEENAMF